MPGFFAAPWSTLALLGAWFFAQLLFGWSFNLIRLLLDRIYDDSLSRSTGRVVEDLLELRDLDGVEVGCGPRNMNGFCPLTSLILLDGRTYHKRDPIFWAIGLHELGHVLIHRVPVLGALLLLARNVWLTLARFERALVLGALIYGCGCGGGCGVGCGVGCGGTLLGEWLTTVLLISLGAMAFVLIDELVASLIALILLARTGELAPRQLLGALIVLVLALGTYVGAFAADLLLYLHLDDLAAVAEQFPTPMRTALPGVLVLILLFCATLYCLAIGGLNLFLVLFDPPKWAEISEDSGTIAALVFVLLTWDRAGGEGLHLACALAILIAARGAITLLGAGIGPILARVPGGRGWAQDKLRELGELASLNLAQLRRSVILRIMTALPWVAVLVYVVWYWVAWVTS